MSALRRKVGATALACLGLGLAVTLTTPLASSPASAAATSATPSDVNGDGYADLVVGVPLEDVGSVKDAGAIQVFYGGANGLAGARSVVLHQDVAGVTDSAETGDHFGAAVAVGRFNSDAYADVAVGIPLEDVGGVRDAGAVQIFYGSASGLGTTGNQFLDQGATGVADTAEAGDRFGSSLVAADLAGSRQTDLAVGVPFEDVGSVVDGGAVHVLRGSAAGITTLDNRVLTQNTAGVNDKVERGDRFGSSLAAGDVAGDGKADLVVGIPLEDVGSVADAGAIQVIRGSARKTLTTTSDQFLTQNTRGAADKSERGDRFGSAVAVGDVSGSSKADVAVGVPLENVGSVVDAGAVHVFRGATRGVSTSGNRVVTQNSSGVKDKAERGDRFGSSLATGNVAGSSKSDLVVGIPYEDVGGQVNAGAIAVLRGSTAGPNGSGDQYLHQSSAGSDAAAERSDLFSTALAVANLVGSSYKDVAIGVPRENVGAAADGGSVQIFRGATAGVTISRDQVIHQSIPDAPSGAETSDRFGSTVAAG